MRHWFKDQHFQSVLKNTSYLAVSKGIAGIAGLAVLAFAGRSLGVLQLGILILIVSYAKAASGLSKFQSWQLVVRYSGQVLTKGDATQFKEGVGFALGLDLLSGILGMIAAIALLPLVGGWFGIGSAYLTAAMLYCLILPTQGAATANGVLRALNRFDLISWQGTSYPIARAVLGRSQSRRQKRHRCYRRHRPQSDPADRHGRFSRGASTRPDDNRQSGEES